MIPSQIVRYFQPIHDDEISIAAEVEAQVN